jgi:hypothetical protein
MSPTDFCFRACRDGNDAAAYCEHIYDTREYASGRTGISRTSLISLG